MTWAMQRQLPMEKAGDYSRNVSRILWKQCPSVEDWCRKQSDGRSIDVIESPKPTQEQFLEDV